VGDALGTTLEFTVRDTLPLHTEMTGGGAFNLPAGVWTDDTSMALALADSLLASHGFDGADLQRRFLRWMDEGEYSPTGRCFDIGITTRQALTRFRQTGNPIAGPIDENSAGNGSLMRLAPAVLYILSDAVSCRQLATAQSSTTHGAPQAIQCCEFFADLLRRAIGGEGKDQLLAGRDLGGHPAVGALAMGSWKGKARNDIRSSGYVIHTLEAALWAIDQTDSFEAALVLAVNLADDADTVGAVAGQLAGSIYGMDAIPPRWLRDLAWRERLVVTADALLLRGGSGTM
jgi:ADP-ribosyl-[dinitrogen reductase] hydrolase